MFNIDSKPTFQTTIKLHSLVEAGAEPPSFKATYRALSDAEYDAIDRSGVDGVKKFIKAALVRLDDLVDDKGSPVTYTDEVRDRLLSEQYMRAALSACYFDAVTGFQTGN